MEFHDMLRMLREKAGLSQEALARAANISVSAVSKLERGGIDPSWSTVQALAKALGVDCRTFQSNDPFGQQPPLGRKKPKPKR